MNCPYCRFAINPRNPKAGRFQPKCPRCAGSFSVVIPKEVNLPWTVTALAGATDVRSTQQIASFELVPSSDAFAATEAPAGREAVPIPTGKDRRAATVGAAAKPRPERAIPSPPAGNELPARLGGYEIDREIGRGGMGAVYLARQVSLDRDVALKVMNAKWASDPIFLARFTREAYAAAQLVHHNVVQIYDIGEEKGIHYFSMEFVDGRSLGDRVKKEGKIEPREAVGLILQAARGLKFAHERGMIHRDVKPDNLLLNFEGIVKVADLGLVKTPALLPDDDRPGVHSGKTGGKLASVSTEMTNAYSAMGSPAYMSPEQGRDAAHVDRRADIYSLGCTLYVLLTGRPPFAGTTALEVMSKHALEELVPPHRIVREVPPELSSILLKMMAKKRDDRYPDAEALIGDLDAFLGNAAGSERLVDTAQIAEWEGLVERFNAAPAARQRKPVILGFAALSGLGGLICITAGFPILGLVLLAACAQTSVAYFILQGILGKSYVFRRVQQALFGCRFVDWLTFAAGAGLLALAVYLSGLVGVWFASAVISALWAFGLYAALDRRLAVQRQPILDDARNLFRRWRIVGMDEDRLRGLAVRFGGRYWEEFYEALFGYEAKLKARAELAETEGLHARAAFAPWRDGLIQRIDALQQARREARERKYLRSVEARKLEAEGLDRRAAEGRAGAEAERMVDRAAEAKAAGAAPAKARKIVRMTDAIDDGQPVPKRMVIPLRMRIGRKLGVFFGAKVRFLLGALLIAGGSLWIKQNLDRFRIALPQDKASAMSALTTLLEATDSAKPLHLALLPKSIGALFAYFNPLVAGILLMLSLLFRGLLVSLCFLLGSAVAFVGYRFVPPGMPFKPEGCAMAAGLAVGAFGFLISRRRRD